jgi:hypothetical protein
VDVNLTGPAPPSQQELSKDAQRAIESFRTIATLMITSPAFRQISSDVILLTRDIFADAASTAADALSNAADGVAKAGEKARPSEGERKGGVDLNKAQSKGKEIQKSAQSGKLQGQAKVMQAQAKESIWDEVEQMREYVDDKLPDGEEAREMIITRLQEVSTQIPAKGRS